MGEKVKQTDFPRINLKCNNCENEFAINVVRMREKQAVVCQVCGAELSAEIGEKFAKALEDLYMVKYLLEKDSYPFHFSFVYKTSFAQPPAPAGFDQEQTVAKT